MSFCEQCQTFSTFADNLIKQLQKATKSLNLQSLISWLLDYQILHKIIKDSTLVSYFMKLYNIRKWIDEYILSFIKFKVLKSPRNIRVFVMKKKLKTPEFYNLWTH